MFKGRLQLLLGGGGRAKCIIISGERRWRATKQAGLTHIGCYLHEGEISEADILKQQLVENLLREDLRPIEQARAVSSLMTLHGCNGKQVAKALHLSESKVSRSLALLDLPKDIQEKVDAGDAAPPRSLGDRQSLERRH